MQDIRYALRVLRKAPGYALAAVAALAIGIGANTAVFSVVNGVLLKGFPYRDPQQLVLLYERLAGSQNKFGFAAHDFEIVRGAARSYSGFAAYRTIGYELSDIATPQRIVAARVTPDLFAVLGAAPAAGRTLASDDDHPGVRVAVVSHGLWSRAFGRDPALLGRTISLDRQSYTVVGIMPERFEFPPRGGALNGEPADVFLPMAFAPFERQVFGIMYDYTVIGRLRPDVTLTQARAEASGLLPQLAEHYPAPLRNLASQASIPISSLYEEIVSGSRRLLVILMAAVALVLLIGCADVAGLILTRSAARQRELAIRAALGATRARLVRQLLAEACVMAVAGCTLGLALAYWAMRALVSMAGQKLPRVESIAFDWRVVAFATALAVLTPLVFGIVPALRSARGTDREALQEGTRSLTTGRPRARLLGLLVVGQFALALVLAVGAGLLVRSFMRLVQADAGFRSARVVRATVTLPRGRYGTPQQANAFYQQLVAAARSIPGVTDAGAGSFLPLAVRERRNFTPDAGSLQIPDQSRLIAPTWTAGRYFETLGIPLKRGRFFTDADGPGSQLVVIVNEQLARLVWPDADAVGHQIRWGTTVLAPRTPPLPWMTVVGVVGDVKESGLDAPAMPQAYIPVAQEAASAWRTVNLVVRSSRDSASVIADVRQSLGRMDPALPATAEAMDETVGESVRPQRFSMTVMTLFAALALMLAALGIYGVLANAVAQQTQEIGVRVALGATTFDVMWMVLQRALTLMGIGLVIGTVGALALTRTMTGLLFEVRATDAVSFLGAAGTLAVIALAASLVPAWRATRVDPIVALRTE